MDPACPLSPAARKLLARRAIGLATSTDYVDWALSELLAGADTPSLRILAGLPKPPYWPEVERYFEKALEEMGGSVPEPGGYLRGYVRELARSIVAGEMPPLEGMGEIYQIWERTDYPDSLWRWLYLMDELDPETSNELGNEQWEAAIRREALRLLQDPNAPW